MKKVVTFGEIMLRLSTEGYERFVQSNKLVVNYGGGEANVAASVANYGIPVEFISRLPKNDIGEACKKSLLKHEIGTSYIQWGGDRLGIYFLETGSVSRSSKVVYDRANSSFSQIEPGMFEWEKIFQDTQWFHWSGITPAISQSAADACLEAIKVANKLGITVSCDLNYRKKLWKYGKAAMEVMPELVACCDVILGNEEDAEMSLGIKPDGVDVTSGHVDATAYKSVSQKIMQEYPRCKKVVTTLRGSISANHNSWSGVLWNGKTLFEAPTYQITHIVDRVGGGDSFMGGLIYGLISWPEDEQRALNYAVATSCLKHTIPGDFNLVSVEEVTKLMEGDASGRVSR